jgi:hypothetical protein
MSRVLALIAGGVVQNVILGEIAEYPGAIDVTDLNPRPAAGWLYQAGDFDPPPPAAAPNLGTRITKLAFRQRLTDPVLVAIELAAIHNPAATPQQQQFAAQLRVMLENVRVATFIDLSRPDTRAGVQALEAAGLLPSAAAVLDAPVQASEVPTGF